VPPLGGHTLLGDRRGAGIFSVTPGDIAFAVDDALFGSDDVPCIRRMNKKAVAVGAAVAAVAAVETVEDVVQFLAQARFAPTVDMTECAGLAPMPFDDTMTSVAALTDKVLLRLNADFPPFDV
jgi:hypothetical protein